VAKIERAALDGTERSVIVSAVSSSLEWPNGLTIGLYSRPCVAEMVTLVSIIYLINWWLGSLMVRASAS